MGVAYGYWGVVDQGMSLESGLLAGGLCSVSGMLPDLDSDSGIPLRETSLFIAAIAPMLMIDRWRDMGLSHESMALAAMLIYIAIRFVAVEFFRRYTVHRGMWHSIPAAFVAGMIAYLVMPCPSEGIRVYKSLAVFVGFMTHLILDEIWSLDFSSGGFRVKKSFGTALKFFGNNWLANVSVYGKLVFLIYLGHGDHAILDRLRQRIRLDREQYTLPSNESYPSYSLPWGSDTASSASNVPSQESGREPLQYGQPTNPYQQPPSNQWQQPYQQQPFVPQPFAPQQNAPQQYLPQHRVAAPRSGTPTLPY